MNSRERQQLAADLLAAPTSLTGTQARLGHVPTTATEQYARSASAGGGAFTEAVSAIEPAHDEPVGEDDQKP
ncbi:hypothetical protein ACFYN3_39470 [Streptomyces lavendulae]|uniref:hypothetical protein n=1 Tax=Streptomyces lavendulae TaxID=1914 RepID=UPI0033F763FF